MDASRPLTFAVPTAPDLFAWAPHRPDLRPAPILPMSRAELDALGWDACDVILVTGDAYVDHPSFGMALVGRLLEAHGFRVGIIAQPDWSSADAFTALGRPRLFFGITAGNMDSMVNRYTSNGRIRSDDAYTPGGEGGARPDRASIVYAQRCREAFKGVGIVLGGIEASLRRIAHFDYWSEKVRRCILLDAKADLLLYGNAERALVEVAHRAAAGEALSEIDGVRGVARVRRGIPEGYTEIDSREIDAPGPVEPRPSPYAYEGGAPQVGGDKEAREKPARVDFRSAVVRMPSFEAVKDDPVLYAHASRILHREANPGNARALVQAHGDRDVWLSPPPVPLTTPEMDRIYELPYARRPHPAYGGARIPAWEMIRFSITIQRGCFGGCTFCSITEHEGRIIQNRSKDSILKEIKELEAVPGFTGVISDLGGPTANMYRIACKSREIEAACRRPSCVYPAVCENLNTDHSALIDLYRSARKMPEVKKVFIASGVRYDLAVEDPAYVKELATHHVGGYLKIAPEHVAEGPLSKMMKPGIGAYERFKTLFDKASREAGKAQYLIPYFIAAHPGTTDEDMLELALWLKANGFKADQVQTYLPSPMATATAMYHSGKNPLKKVSRGSEEVPIPKGLKIRRLHKAFLRYHAPESWPLLYDALRRMGRQDLIGFGEGCLIPPRPPRPAASDDPGPRRGRPRGGEARTQHTGLERAARPAPPRGGREDGKRQGRGRRDGPRGKGR